MTRPTNIGASVHQRLKNAAKDSGRSFNDLAQPVNAALVGSTPFQMEWLHPGPWRVLE